MVVGHLRMAEVDGSTNRLKVGTQSWRVSAVSHSKNADLALFSEGFKPQPYASYE